MASDDKVGTFIGDLAEEIFGDVVRGVVHELRPDIMFADEFPEVIKSLDDISPKAVVKGLVKDFMSTGKK